MKLVLASLLSAAAGFQLAPLALRQPMPVVMGIAESAEACLEEGCSLDTVDVLIADLKDEYKASPKAATFALIAQLEKLNVDPEANKGQLEKLIAGAARLHGQGRHHHDRGRRA